MFNIQILLIIILHNFIFIYSEIDYCNKDLLCKSASGPHIKCNNDGKFSRKCPDNVKLIKLSNEDRQRIVASHNIKRNEIASGRIPGYGPAERMALMGWSSELERMAELNVKTCIFHHDKCRNTPNYRKSGQNLAMWKGYPSPNNPKDQFYRSINDWFLEYKHCNMSYIHKYEKHHEGKKIGHFTVMVSERNNRVGCAAVIFPEEKFTKIILACNYAYTNIIQQPVYKVGNSGSGCKEGIDPTYTSVCQFSEKYY